MRLTKRILHNKAKPMDFRFPQKNTNLAMDLIDFMVKENGIGLAAPQVGISRRLFVMKIGLKTWACFNPEILEWGKDFTKFDEGCLSFPGESCIISRPDYILVKYQTAGGDLVQEEMSGLASRCFQHELDHLDGITMHQRKVSHAI